jgi:hypothetical protein
MSGSDRRPLLVPGGAAALAGCVCLGAAGLILDQGGQSWGAWGWVPWALIVGGLGCFVLAGVQGRRAKAGTRGAAARPMTRRSLRSLLILCHVGLVAFGALAGFGGYLLQRRNSGPHIAVTVTRCKLVDPGPSMHVSPHDYCYGDWTYRGQAYVDKYVQGAGLADQGHVIDATLHGDTAYSRDLQTPLILLGLFGTASLVALGGCVTTWRRWVRGSG